jgi:cytochrome c-type biogenesis protein CcmH
VVSRCCGGTALAQEAQLADPALEQRARDLSREIRCVVCQSQSVADSDADIAREVRAIIREQIAAGKSDQDNPRLPGRALWRLRAARSAVQGLDLRAVDRAVRDPGAGRDRRRGVLSAAARRNRRGARAQRRRAQPGGPAAAGRPEDRA